MFESILVGLLSGFLFFILKNTIWVTIVEAWKTKGGN